MQPQFRDPNDCDEEDLARMFSDDLSDADDQMQSDEAMARGMQDDMDAGIVRDEQDLRDIVMLCEVDARQEARRREAEILEVVKSLGGNGRAFRRERARRSRAIIAEFYSPPRISALAKELPGYGIAPGLALDPTVPDENGVPTSRRQRDERRRNVA